VDDILKIMPVSALRCGTVYQREKKTVREKGINNTS
jgi:hypothetical protein